MDIGRCIDDDLNGFEYYSRQVHRKAIPSATPLAPDKTALFMFFVFGPL